LLASKLGTINIIEPLYNSENYITVRDVIWGLTMLNDGDGDIDKADPVHRTAKLSELNKTRIKQSTAGGTWRDWDKPLLLECHKNSSERRYGAVYGQRTVWTPDRALSYREGAILQSFPKDYIFVNNEPQFNSRELGRHIGNAVPVELGRAIGLSITSHLKEVGIDG
jgi:DNA (cytosine-5)-methyltransferase 1